MKLIPPHVEFLGAMCTDRDLALRFIEVAGRVCYKSEDKITDTSARPFVERLIKAGHLAMIEHSNFVVKGYDPIPDEKFLTTLPDDSGNDTFVGGNLRAWFEASQGPNKGDQMFVPFLQNYGEVFGLEKRLTRYNDNWVICPYEDIPEDLHRYAVRFVCDRGVSHELVRHRPCSFAQESTRYVNYGGKDMEFIEPAFFEAWQPREQTCFYNACQDNENRYNNMLMMGLKPQQARAVLPNALKTEIVVTADTAEWAHIRKLRTAKDAHPDMQRVMNLVPWWF